MKAALGDGRADRVVFDARYSRGGDYTAADPLREALAALTCPVTMITGTDNVSAASALAEWLRHDTRTRFVGAPPPTITNPFSNEVTFTLPNSGVIVHVPTNRWIFDANEHLSAMPMDVAVRDRGSSFFRGVDDTLPVALR